MPKRAAGAWLPLPVGADRAASSLRELIYRHLLDAIVAGRLTPGARLPSGRQLAAEWHVARNTVDDAVGALQAEGLLNRRVGAGTYVAGSVRPARSQRDAPRLRAPTPFGRDALAAISRWGGGTVARHRPGVVPRPQAFVAAQPDLDAFPFELWRRLTARRLRTSARALAGYLPSLGLPALRAATARHLALSRGLVCEPDQVMILNSAIQAVDLVARVLLDAKAQVWIEDPCYPNLRAALGHSGARLVPVPVDDNGMDVAAGVARAPHAALAHVTSSCHFPLGVRLSAERRRALLDWAARAGSWIVENDYQSEFTYAGRPLASLAGMDRSGRVIHVGTFTNAVFPSLRLAYVVLPPALVDVFDAVRGQLDDHSYGLGQAVLADFIDGGHFAAHLRRMRQLYQSRRDALVDACARRLPDHVRLGPVTSGMSTVLYVNGRRSDQVLAERARAEGVELLPLSRYALRASLPPGLLVGYTALDERKIGEGVQRLARAFGTTRARTAPRSL